MNKFNELYKTIISEMTESKKKYFFHTREYDSEKKKFGSIYSSSSNIDYVDPSKLSKDEQEEFEELLVKNPIEDPSYRDDVQGDVMEVTIYSGIDKIERKFYCLKHNLNHLIGLIDRTRNNK